VEGVYGIKAQLPAIAGNEGVAVVREVFLLYFLCFFSSLLRLLQVGNQVKNLKAGDWVIPRGGGFGTWRDEAVVHHDQVDQIPNDIPRPYAAIIGVNPSTAYRLLQDFGNLKPGDWVIQNGANSMVGLAVVQIAALAGLKTINIIRSDKPESVSFNDLRLLDMLGGTINISSDFLQTQDFKDILAELDGPLKLGLNCVGGEVTTDMARALSYGGTLVTYGGMAKQPVVVPQEVLNYKNLTLEGFWLTEWVKT
jgi:mitochondrial enoyl-[acyl-carrier protein] reductase / trans-2-enoyl-CoA reductase